MRFKSIIAGAIATLAVFVLPAFAFAAAPPTAVAMSGQLIVMPGRQTTQVQVGLKSNDSQGWFMNLSLSIPVTERERDDEEENHGARYTSISEGTRVNVRGIYSLGAQSQTLSSGAITGTLNSSGTFNIRLSDQSKSTSLSMVFTIAGNGAVSTVAEGQWPPIPSPATAAPATAVSPVSTVSPVSPAAPQTPTTEITPVAPVLPAFTPATIVSSVPEQQPVQQSNSHFFWYLSRTSALAAYILLFINVCLGIGLKTKYLDFLWRRWLTFDLHQFTAILGGSLIILHIFSLLGDSYLKFTISELLVPMSSPYRPLWTALGTVGFYAGVIVALSFYIRKIIGQKTWRILHFMSFALFLAILVHGIKAGTDTSTAWVQWLYISTGTIVTFLSLWRFLSYRSGQALKPDKVQNRSPETA